MHRRKFLRIPAFAAIATSAGCSSPFSNNDPKANDITIVNKRDEVVFFDLVLYQADSGKGVSSTRHSIGSGKKTIENVADFGTYNLTMSVDGMPDKSRTWHATDCHHLTITIRKDSVKFAEKTC